MVQGMNQCAVPLEISIYGSTYILPFIYANRLQHALQMQMFSLQDVNSCQHAKTTDSWRFFPNN